MTILDLPVNQSRPQRIWHIANWTSAVLLNFIHTDPTSRNVAGGSGDSATTTVYTQHHQALIRFSPVRFSSRPDAPQCNSIIRDAECRRRCRHGQHTAITGVSDNIDGLRHTSDSRVVQKQTLAPFSRRPQIECIQGAMTAAARILEQEDGVCRADIDVLILVGLRAASINRELAKVAVDGSALATRRIRCQRPDCSSGDGSW